MVEKDGIPVDKGIEYSISVLSQFITRPTKVHMKKVHMKGLYRILRYLKSAAEKGVYFRKTNNKNIEVYADVDWASSPSDRIST